MSRAPASQRVESERRVLDCILRNGKEARTKDLRSKSGLAPGTLHSVLRDLEGRGILEAHRERHQTTYQWTKKTEDYYRGIIPRPIRASRKYYEGLTRLVSMDATPDEFVQQTIPAIGITILPVLLEAVDKNEELLIQPVIDDFLFFVKKYLVYRKYPESRKDPSDEINRLGSAFGELQETPAHYKAEISQIQSALERLQQKLRKEFSQ